MTRPKQHAQEVDRYALYRWDRGPPRSISPY